MTASFCRQAYDFFHPYFESESRSSVACFQQSYPAGFLSETRCQHSLSAWLLAGIMKPLAGMKFGESALSWLQSTVQTHCEGYVQESWLVFSQKNTQELKYWGKSVTLINVPVLIIISLIITSFWLQGRILSWRRGVGGSTRGFVAEPLHWILTNSCLDFFFFFSLLLCSRLQTWISGMVSFLFSYKEVIYHWLQNSLATL